MGEQRDNDSILPNTSLRSGNLMHNAQKKSQEHQSAAHVAHAMGMLPQRRSRVMRPSTICVA